MSATPPIASLHHAAIPTRDLGRFLDFYCGVLGLEHVLTAATPGMRHAFVRCGSNSWLHPVEAPAAAECGPRNHIALAVTTAQAFADLRCRLLACGASDGRIDDLGAYQAMTLSDPDGMHVVLTLIVDPSLRSVHAPIQHIAPLASAVSLERVESMDRWPSVDSLLREYVPWVMERFKSEHGIQFDNVNAEMEKHHESFAADAEAMLSGRGRVLLAHLNGQPAGLVALKPVDKDSAEVKRMYVRPSARGQAVGRALLLRLLGDARAEGFRVLRLETAAFMREAHTLYKAFGFRDAPSFTEAQSAMSGLTDVVRFMELQLRC